MDSSARNLEALIRLIKAAGVKDDEAASSASVLLKRYLSAGPVFEAETGDLLSSGAPTMKSAELIHLIAPLARYVISERNRSVRFIRCFGEAADYFRPLFLGVHTELSYIMCLEENGRVTALELMERGTVDETPFYIRHMLETLLRHDAKAVILP